MRSTDVVIIGAGAAGLMCAMTAAARGRQVLLLDHSNKAGKKILMSGGGRCNFTNMYAEPANFASANPHFCKSALARYTPWDFIALVSEHGVPYHEKKLGQLFCDNRSKDILELLLEECRRAGVELHLRTAVQQIERRDDGYLLETDLGPVAAASLVVATGGLSIPTLGATGFGYEVARQFGHSVLPTRAGLVPFTLSGPLRELCAELSGTSVEECVVSCNGESFRENILFTHRGLSGPAILQISSFWRPGDVVEINLLADRDAFEWLQREQAARPNSELKTVLGEVFTKKLAALLVERWFAAKPMKQHTPAELRAIADRLAAWRVAPAGTEGYRTAEVTLGGVDTREVSSKTMESRRSPGLYFIGEVLDVSGHLGGFNFQWAWASGHAAAQVV
ncbi:NAD(P)/FAD-dependent oxidoreductase [Conexibacter sp. JD483]|uniref:NAD(P)/FAD-dependent oxidoreductase n=1 Tax=unclassified Conexibacter TaxID=2627773 RepID=UPI0027228479|nr:MULTISPECIES: NAD(P)/FAD-dependent oxidoreductase [unclassified Conexibacter]MDO8186688.1 NAD(P)/FAD-dependent oxidoreductase [Conexibacter sp. CPCC 205706]MDO8200408.1 NAD(P)/FAD-dependent oxidoreductase [Conexibacter sp. CPCC 205762]MDR9371072.1 NAD(P)/FAD-dependent oxidoreductase [Conexibacter sp. JD483]